VVRASSGLALALVVVFGCGGDDEVVPPSIDATAVADAAATVDAAPDAMAGCPACASPLPVCDEATGRCVECGAASDCAGLAFRTVCLAPTGSCRECVTTADCAAASETLGPSCDEATGYCRCVDSGECVDNPNGAICDSELGACTCVDDGDCMPPRACMGQSYLGPSARTCQVPP
jgi:hypothetical protein